MSLKKPSDFFNKKQQIGSIDESIQELSGSTELNTFSDAFDSFKNNLTNFEVVTEKVENIQTEIQSLLKKEDLDRALMSQLLIVEKSIREVQDKVKSVNEETLYEIRSDVSELTDIVENLLEVEFPKYKKQLTKNQFNISDKFDSLKEVVEDNIVSIKEEVDNKLENVAEALDQNLEYFNQQLQETSSEVKKTTDTYNKLSKIVESRVSKENETLEEYSETIKSLYEAFVDLQNSLQEETSSQIQIIDEKFNAISSEVDDKINTFDEEISNFKQKISSEVSNVKADVVINEQHLKKVENYIQENHQEIVNLKEEVFAEIDRIPVGDVQENIERLEKKIDFIRETYSKIEPEVVVKEVIKEGLLNIPPEEKTSDPLSPLDKNYVTLEQLQEHYRLFINRIQQQLSTLGGGGETRLRYLDDVVGVATNSSAYDGKYLQWNSTTNTAEFADVSGAGVQVNSDWNATTGISSILNKPTIVNQIVAGTGITISPASGVGIVTITATGGTGAATTGYYGSFYDTTTQYATGVGVTTKVYLNTTAAANGFSIQSGSRIVAENAGIYNTQFSFQLDKASGAGAHILVWLSKNGVDLPETNSKVAVQGENAEVVPAWNFIVDMIAGDYIEYKWMTDDTNVGITSASIPTIGSPPVSINVPDIPSAIVTIQQIAGVVAGVGSTTQTLNQTLGYGNTSSLGIIVGVSTFGTNNNTVVVGGANTALVVNDNARVTGILTAGIISSLDGGTFAGVVTATSYNGSGSNLTGIVTYITAGSGISVNQNTGNVTVTNTGPSLTGNNIFTGINTFTGSNTFSGSIIIEQASEAFNKYSTSIASAGIVTFSCASGNIHYITSTVSGNWTANLTNVGVTSGYCANYTLVIIQGATAYIPSALQIDGVSQTLNWQGGSQPSGNNSKKDVIAYTVFNDAGTYTVYAQLVTFG